MGVLYVLTALTVFIVSEARYVSDDDLHLLERMLDILDKRACKPVGANVKVLGEGKSGLDVTSSTSAILANDQCIDVKLAKAEGNIKIEFRAKLAQGFILKINGKKEDEASLKDSDSLNSEDVTLSYNGPSVENFKVEVMHGNGLEVAIKNFQVLVC